MTPFIVKRRTDKYDSKRLFGATPAELDLAGDTRHLIAQALRQWKEGQRERERRAVMDARVKLEDEFNKPD